MNEGTEFNPRGSDWLPEAGDSWSDAKWYVGMNQEGGHQKWLPLQKFRNETPHTACKGAEHQSGVATRQILKIALQSVL